MTTTMHALLTSAVASREQMLGGDATFATQHGVPVRRAIQRRRVATYAGTGSAVAVASLAAAYGFHEFSGGTINPAGAVPATAAETAAPTETSTVTTTLVQVPIDESVYEPGETSRLYVYYATRGGAQMVPFPPSGIYYPGIDDVPADAFIVTVNGGVDGYDLDAPDADAWSMGAFSMVSDRGDLVGPHTPASSPIMWENVGRVSSTTEWGVRYYLVDGRLVSVSDGQTNPNAVEVVAMYEPPVGS